MHGFHVTGEGVLPAKAYLGELATRYRTFVVSFPGMREQMPV